MENLYRPDIDRSLWRNYYENNDFTYNFCYNYTHRDPCDQRFGGKIRVFALGKVSEIR